MSKKKPVEEQIENTEEEGAIFLRKVPVIICNGDDEPVEISNEAE